MIKCRKNNHGGSVTVRDGSTTTVLEFTVSDSSAVPLVLHLKCGGIITRVVSALLESMVLKYRSPVVFTELANAQLRYMPSIANTVFRQFTHESRSVYTQPFPDSARMSRLLTLAEAMNSYCFVRTAGEDLQMFDRYTVLGTLRRHMTPFEFMSVKEECDYGVQNSCVDTTRKVIAAARSALTHAGSHSAAFTEILNRVDGLQNTGAAAFDTKTSYIREAIECILLPALVLLGHENPFTRAVAGTFVQGAADYTSLSEEFMGTYEDALKFVMVQSKQKD